MNNNNNSSDTLIVRLDILIKLLLRKEFSDNNKKLNLGEAVKFLSTCGLEPIEIARLVGKNKSAEIAVYLYPKKKGKQNASKS